MLQLVSFILLLTKQNIKSNLTITKFNFPSCFYQPCTIKYFWFFFFWTFGIHQYEIIPICNICVLSVMNFPKSNPCTFLSKPTQRLGTGVSKTQNSWVLILLCFVGRRSKTLQNTVFRDCFIMSGHSWKEN